MLLIDGIKKKTLSDLVDLLEKWHLPTLGGQNPAYGTFTYTGEP